MNDVPPPPPPYGSPPPGAGGPDAGAAISYGWNKFTQNVGPLIGIVVAPIAAILVLEFIGFALVRGFFGFVIFFALALLVSMAAYLGIFNAGLMATSGQRVDFGKAFQTDRWGDWIVFSILYGLLIAVGFAVCFVGALVVIAFWGLAPFYFLDQGKSAGEALSASLATTRANPGLPVALGLLALVGWIGGVVCVGQLVTLPIAIIGAAFLYRQATGQPVAP